MLVVRRGTPDLGVTRHTLTPDEAHPLTMTSVKAFRAEALSSMVTAW